MKLRDLSRKIRAPFNKWTAIKKLEQFHSKKRSLDELIDMAMDFKTSGLYRINSVQKREEILSLAKAVDSIRPKTILEIGTCNGGTLFIWANLASECVITCDLNKSKVREDLYRLFTPKSSKCEVISLAGDSHDPSFLEEVKKSLKGKTVDFLFIDGDHTEAGVKSDYNMYSHLVRPGGIIAFHDILEKQPMPSNQVYYFWKEIKKSTKTEEFISDRNQTGFGIGIIHVE